MKKNACMLLRYDLYGADVADEPRHPSEVVSNLGIRYQAWVSQPIADCIHIWGCEDVPQELPRYLSRHDGAQPQKHVGFGLRAENAEALEIWARQIA